MLIDPKPCLTLLNALKLLINAGFLKITLSHESKRVFYAFRQIEARIFRVALFVLCNDCLRLRERPARRGIDSLERISRRSILARLRADRPDFWVRRDLLGKLVRKARVGFFVIGDVS